MASNFEHADIRGRSYHPTSGDMGPEKWLDVDGIRTRYFDEGEGEPGHGYE